jgi:hypothetical protein
MADDDGQKRLARMKKPAADESAKAAINATPPNLAPPRWEAAMSRRDARRLPAATSAVGSDHQSAASRSDRTLGVMGIWTRPGLRCELQIGNRTSTLRLLGEQAVLREETVDTIDAGIRLARLWERDQPVAKVEAVLDLLLSQPPIYAPRS